mgnify:CR=1 FL=1
MNVGSLILCLPVQFPSFCNIRRPKRFRILDHFIPAELHFVLGRAHLLLGHRDACVVARPPLRSRRPCRAAQELLREAPSARRRARRALSSRQHPRKLRFAFAGIHPTDDGLGSPFQLTFPHVEVHVRVRSDLRLVRHDQQS